MARKRAAAGTGGAASKKKTLDFGTVSEQQQAFLDADTFFVCYGGARGGGKTHVARLKAVGMCLHYPGIRILMVRAHYPELEENLVRPILKWVPADLYRYNGTSHLLTFGNGSIIKFGHWDGDNAEKEYQGVEYDVIFLEEATQLSERAFLYLQTCIRGTNDFPKRMYLTCNPGGVGHNWVKRLFIKKDYHIYPNDPERSEDPSDYTFIFATVDDNPWLLKSSPRYLKNLSSMPEDLRMAHRYGDWDAISGGNYFKNFSPQRNVFPRFPIPAKWPLYRSLDYGLDMLAVGWWAIDEDGRCWCFREYEESGLVVRDAADAIRKHTLPNEVIQTTYAPPDMWNKQKDTGKSIQELYLENGVAIVKTNNDRVQGHMIMKNMLAPVPLKDPFVKSLFKEGQAPETMPGMMFFEDLERVISDITSIQTDEKNPNDCAKEPHDVTHTVDMCRYFAVSRVMEAEGEKAAEAEEDEEEVLTDYETYMCGGDITQGYVGFAG